METLPRYYAAVIGAGPAGLFAARELASQNVHVVLFNRDIKPGGLAEYGIYPDKHRMKEGLRNQFRLIIDRDDIDYYGNITVGNQGDLRLSELAALGFQAVLVTSGAQGTKWLGLPGENLDGVYHAKDLVYHYNHLPPYSHREFHIGRRVAVIGAGNVSLDIARYLSSLSQVEEILAVIRRGPAEIKFSRAELENVVNLLDLDDLAVEMKRLTPLMLSLGQNPKDVDSFIRVAQERACETTSNARFRLRFLISPTRILGDKDNRVIGLDVEENTLVLENGEGKAVSLETHHTVDVDTVIFAIGDRVDDNFGLPVKGSEYLKNPDPAFPVENTSFEVYDPVEKGPMKGMFVAGWSRKASNGLVGVARKDGVNGARAVLQYLNTLAPINNLPLELLARRISSIPNPVIHEDDLKRLEAVERDRAQQLGLEEYKFNTNQEMLVAVGLLPEVLSGSSEARG